MQTTTQTPTNWNSMPEIDLISGNERFAEDAKLYKQFSMAPVEDVLESQAKGRKIFRDAEFVTIMIPGDRGNRVVQEVDDLIRQRFPREYAAFKAGIKEQISGTPLDMLPGMVASRAAEYAYIGIRTIEMLADASDAVGSNFMGFQTDKQKAKAYLALAEGKSLDALDEKLSAENAKLQETIKGMQAKLEQLVKTKATKE